MTTVPSSSPTVLGIPLEPGERVLFFDKPSRTKIIALLWIAGILTLPAVVGILFIYLAFRLEHIYPRGKFVTNRRLVHVTRKGEPIEVPLHEIRRLEVERKSADLTSGILVAAATATYAAMHDHTANQMAKTDPRYWSRATAVVVIADRGELWFASKRAPQLGVFLANAIPMMWENPSAFEQLPIVTYKA